MSGSDRYMWREAQSVDALTQDQLNALEPLWEPARGASRSFWKRAVGVVATLRTGGLDKATHRRAVAAAEAHPGLISRVGLRHVSGFGAVCTLTLPGLDDVTVAVRKDAALAYERLTELMHSAGTQRIDGIGAPPSWIGRNAITNESPAARAAITVAQAMDQRAVSY